MNGADREERYSPPPGTFPRKLSGSRQQQGKPSQASHGVFIPARDEASDDSVLCLTLLNAFMIVTCYKA